MSIYFMYLLCVPNRNNIFFLYLILMCMPDRNTELHSHEAMKSVATRSRAACCGDPTSAVRWNSNAVSRRGGESRRRVRRSVLASRRRVLSDVLASRRRVPASRRRVPSGVLASRRHVPSSRPDAFGGGDAQRCVCQIVPSHGGAYAGASRAISRLPAVRSDGFPAPCSDGFQDDERRQS
ncbi:hypothetical protein GUJ93_ZPchr0002g26419 [Zizania palustris]|uniref:Uncharacterized protein n=1 Tax=Zizania palustris TaxID=103762 RepID=A0A8J5V4Y2_ZIZPA|nr:hypothetical protein GUJ93_ZPchr0002g26419 [Zizania palustris]